MKKLMVAAVFLALGFAFMANAQEQTKTEKNDFKPGWYIMANGGVSWFLAEGNNFLRNSTNDYFSLLNNAGLNARLGAGYDFTSVYGVRANVGYTATNWPDWRNAFVFKSFDAYYLNADFVMNLSNLIKGYNPQRLIDFSAFAGLGGDMRNQGELTSNWLNMVGRLGAQADLKITPQLALNLIGDMTIAGDNYNDYIGGKSVDLLPALSLGLTYRIPEYEKKTVSTEPTIEPKADTTTVPVVKPDTIPVPEKPLVAVVDTVKKIETPVVPVVVPEPKVPVAPAAALREDIFFAINKSNISNAEQQASVNKVIEYLNANPNAKIIVSGYADKATGTSAVNKTVSKNRAVNVANTLISKYGISADRIMIKWYGSDVQPYTEVVKNRLVIINSDEAAQVKSTPVSTGVTAGFKEDVFFSLEGFEVNNAKQNAAITKAIEYLKQNPNAKLVLSGYASVNTGTKEYNDELSKKRALAVANLLIRKYKIDFNRIHVKWFGAGKQPYMVPAMNQLVIMRAE